MADNSFLGEGMKFPPQIDPATGRVLTSKREQSVKESIYLILMTRKTERLVRPNFGSVIESYAFMDTGYTVLNMMARELSETILNQEPRVADVDINIVPQLNEGRLILNIDYLIAASNTRDNLVFPFYLDGGVEEETEEQFPVQEEFYEDDESEE